MLSLAKIIIYLSVYLGLFAVSFYLLTFFSGKKRKIPLFSDKEFPFVSVIIPAYNEEKSIEKTIESVLSSDYPHFEVLVVDDGSKDRTYELAKKYRSKQVKVFTKPNGGKATALNFAIEKCQGEIIFTMDADTFAEPQTMKKMVRPFKNPKVMSVTPAMLVEKPKTLWQRVQHIEYLLGIFLRRVFSLLNAIYIAPGAFSAYRKTFFQKHGGYQVGNITEDLEVALRVQYNGYITENCPDAPVHTIAPRTFKELTIQRRRWYYGLMKNFWHYKKMINRKYGDLGLFVIPIAWLCIFFSVFIVVRAFFKAIFELNDTLVFLSKINYDFNNFFQFNFYFIERFLFSFFTNPVVIFILISFCLISWYLVYAYKKTKEIGKFRVNLPLFFIFFAPVFAFWWFVSIIYILFSKDLKWR